MSSIRWDDLVFTNRNQLYGAYILRKAYASRVTMGFGFAMACVAAILMSPMIQELFAKGMAKPKVVRDYQGPIELQPLPPIKQNEIPQPQVKAPDVKAIKVVPPRVTNEDIVEEIPTIDEIKNSMISTVNLDGPVEFIETPAVEDIKEDVGDDPGKVWLGGVEIQPQFPGGIAAMMKFLGSEIKYPAMARRIGTEGTVFVQFVVDSDGTIDNVEVIKGIGANCDEEAIRVVAKMPEWKPGRQNGKSVKVRMVVPIKFSLSRA